MQKNTHDIGNWLRLMSAGAVVLAVSACASGATSTIARGGPEEIFPTPELAVEDYVQATRSDSKADLLKILGPKSSAIISSGDAVADKAWRTRFIAAYDSAHEIEDESEGKKLLVIGDNEWPLPIPLVRVEGGWQFDTAVGEQEILNRRIGHNELNVMEICRAYVEAQREYAAQHQLGEGKSEYAQKFVSTTGKHDGLYWPTKSGAEESPFGPLIANARAEGYVHAGTHHTKHEPYHGYYYKILTQQGANAAGGAKSYIQNGHMTEGFALLAFPDKYGDSGVMTFMVDQNGIIYEKNLGRNTVLLAARMTKFDPDASWATPR